jgi:hypothetical protein
MHRRGLTRPACPGVGDDAAGVGLHDLVVGEGGAVPGGGDGQIAVEALRSAGGDQARLGRREGAEGAPRGRARALRRTQEGAGVFTRGASARKGWESWDGWAIERDRWSKRRDRWAAQRRGWSKRRDRWSAQRRGWSKRRDGWAAQGRGWARGRRGRWMGVSTGIQVWVGEGAAGRDCAVWWWSSRSGLEGGVDVARGLRGEAGRAWRGPAAVRRAARCMRRGTPGRQGIRQGGYRARVRPRGLRRRSA